MPQSAAIASGPHQAMGITRESIMAHPSMPVSSPSYRCGPVHMRDRHIFAVAYESDPAAIDALVPDLLHPHPSNTVILQWAKTSVTGLGDYTKLDVFIRCLPLETGLHDNLIAAGAASGWLRHLNSLSVPSSHLLYHAMSFSNSSAAITFGREVMGEPQKWASPIDLHVQQDTIVGTLDYCGERVATATMAYNHSPMSLQMASSVLSAPKATLKVTPDVDGSPAAVQLVGMHHDVSKVHWAYEGHAALHLLSHANAPVDDLPVKRAIGGYHFLADLSLGRGHVLHDYLKV